MSVQIPHFSLPFRFVGGAAVVSEQDSPAEITDCVQSVLRYPKGYRVEQPKFGLPDQTFLQGGADATQILETIQEWEPRADAHVDVTVNDSLVTVGDITVEVTPRTEAA